MKKQKKKKKHIVSWIFSIFCFLCVLTYGVTLGSGLMLALGILALPVQPIQNIWSRLIGKVTVLRPIILAIAFVVACGVLPNTSTENPEHTGMESEAEGETSDSTSDELVEESQGTGQHINSVTPEVTQEPTPKPTLEATPEPTPEPVKVSTPEEVANFSFDAGKIPDYTDEAYVVVNKNVPFFKEKDLSDQSYEYYSDLDSLGRCGVCVASVGQDIMPTEDRGSIGSVKPTGWHTVKYNGVVDGNYLYNRCHLLGYQLTGENANKNNLITGTRYLNVEGMLPFENMVADYVEETGNHVMLRVTPVFEGKNLLASGVLMEAMSVEDQGEGILFNVYCYNVQPNIVIDYKTGESKLAAGVATPTPTPKPTSTPKPTATPTPEPTQEETDDKGAYAVNGNNGKIHMVGECSATGNGKNAMKNPVYFDTYEDAEAYSKSVDSDLDKRKCGNCW